MQRLGPPHWPVYPPGARYGALYDREPAAGLAAARLAGHLIAADLEALGIDVDCLPVADVPVAGGDPVIGDRAYGIEPAKVAAIAGAIAAGAAGRAASCRCSSTCRDMAAPTADSHHRLPVVDTDRATLEATDFAAFRPLAGLPLGMTAHVVFTAVDPGAPATTSVTMVREVIRGFIGFKGLLMSDDVSMKALSGSIAERSRLHCRRLRRRAPLQRQPRRDGARSPARRPSLRARPAQRAEAALAQRQAPEDVRRRGRARDVHADDGWQACRRRNG